MHYSCLAVTIMHYNYIAIEGCIGAGKSTLCSMLSDTIGAKSVFEKADTGNTVAVAVLEETMEYLAILSVNICRVIDPEVIIFGGGIVW